MSSSQQSSSTPTSSLTSIVSPNPDIPPREALDILSHLVPDLVPSITLLGGRLVSHPKYPGTHDLNDLAYKYMHIGNRLSLTNASLSSRMEHYDLHIYFENLYKSTDELFEKAKISKFFRSWIKEFKIGCACCYGFPWVVIRTGDRKDNPMYFDQTVWNNIWEGRFKSVGSTSSFDSKEDRVVTRVLAKREWLVEAMARGIDELENFKEKGGDTVKTDKALD